MSKKTRILFVHNTAMWYRRPFFQRLSERYDIRFVFTHIHVCKDIYGVELSQSIPGLEGVKYRTLANYGGFAPGVIREAMGDYDVLVGGSWDSIPEIIETVWYFTIAKWRRKPFILYREDWGWKRTSWKEKLKAPLIRWITRHSDAILVPGKKHREYFLSLGATPEKVFLMPNVSNMVAGEKDELHRERLAKELNIENKKVILYVGRLVQRKGVDYLIQAFSHLKQDVPNSVLWIIGRGECKGELEALVKKLGLENDVVFIDYIENELLAPYYQLCNVCVVPSITHGMGDPWVFVLNEAMYFGKPVIATDAVGAAFDLIHEGENGFLVPERNAEALYEAMKKILSDKRLEEAMGQKSRRIIEEGFRYENMVEGFHQAIQYVEARMPRKKGRGM